MLGEASDALDRCLGRNFDERVPVAQDLEQCDLVRTEPLVSSLRTCSPADELDGARLSGGPTGNGDRLSAWHLRGEPERQPSAPSSRARARVVVPEVSSSKETTLAIRPLLVTLAT